MIDRIEITSDKSNCLQMFFKTYDLINLYFLCCCGITNTVISVVAINCIEFIETTKRNSRLGQVSEKYIEQIRKRYHRTPLDLPLIFSFLL